MDITKIGEFTALHFEQKYSKKKKWVLCELFWLNPEKETRILISRHEPSANICVLTGRHTDGQLCNIYHKNRVDVVTTAFIGNSFLEHPKNELWVDKSVPLVDITFKLSEKDINQGWFKFDGKTIELPEQIITQLKVAPEACTKR